MPDRIESVISQARKVEDYTRRVCAETQRLQAQSVGSGAAKRGPMATTRARLQMLDLNELREAYRLTFSAIQAANGSEDQGVLQLTRTLIRQEVRRRGVNLYDLFSTAEVGMKE